MKCTWIDKTWYPADEYDQLDVFERRKLYLNQQEQKKHRRGTGGGGGKRDAPRDISAVSTVVSELTASVASIAETVKGTARDLKRFKKYSGYRDSDHESLFTPSPSESDDDVERNHKNSALARGNLKGKKGNP